MRLTKFVHACVLVEEGDARILIDPGVYSRGFEDLDGLSGVLVTHQHADHVDVDRLGALLERNPRASLCSDEGTAEVLAEQGLEAHIVRAGDELDLGISVRVFGERHATIHPDIPPVPNVCYLIGGRFFHPGDSLTVPDMPIDVLGLPTAAPWLKTAEAIDYLREAAPRIAVPIHEALLKNPAMIYGYFERLSPDATELRILDDAGPVAV